MQYQIKELELGGILDQAITLLKNHFGLLIGIVAVFYLPFMLLQGFATVATLPDLPANPTTEDINVYQEAALESTMYALPLALLFGFVVVPISNAAIIDAVARCYLGKPSSIGSAYSHAFRVLLPLIWTWILQMLAITFGFMLLIIPGIIFMYWFWLSTHTVVIGGESGKAALSRSKKLMKGNLGTFIALGFILFVIQWGIGMGTMFITQPHLSLVCEAILGTIAFLFSTVVIVVFYFSCRCKVENFDLTLLAEGIGLDEEPDAATVEI